jgi:APA family basic amino acid/polyamine antiporter
MEMSPAAPALCYNFQVRNQKPGLVRAIGRWSLAALMLNIMIGGGVFGLPGTVAGILGSQSPIAYLIVALGMATIAACFAEVASRFQRVGGPYLYAKVAFGRFLGLQVGWLLWLTRVSAAAAVANVFLDYLLLYFPQTNGPLPRFVILTILIGGLAAINIRGVRMGTQVSNFLTAAKLLPLVILLSGGFYFLHSHTQSLYATPESHPIGAWMRAVLLIVFAYAGFEAALVPAAEVEDPAHDAPFAIATAMIVVTVLYSLLQVVVMRVRVTPEASHFALSAAARVIGGSGLAGIVSAGALISTTGYFAATMIATPRITLALAENRDFPGWFGLIHPRYRTPYTSILAFAILVWVLSLAGTFRWNASLSAAAHLFVYAVSCAALPVLRRKCPRQAGFQLPGGLAFPLLGLAFAISLASCMGTTELIVLSITSVAALLNWLAVRAKAM